MAVTDAPTSDDTSLAARFVPILSWLPSYRREWLMPDGVAALSVWALLVPQGLAYATIAGVPVQYGLYTAFAALIAYAVFGSSKQMVQGPSAAVAAVSAATVAGIIGSSALGTDNAAAWSAALALAAAAVYLVLGIGRMGWVSNFLSKAVMAGFVLGFSIGIVVDQSYKLFGVEKVEGDLLPEADPERPLSSSDALLGSWAPWLGVLVYAVGVTVSHSTPPGALPSLLVVLYAAWTGQVLGDALFGAYASGFVGAVVMTLVAYQLARLQSTMPVYAMFLPGFWLLVPGSLGLIGLTTFLAFPDSASGTDVFAVVGAIAAVALGVLCGVELHRWLVGAERRAHAITRRVSGLGWFL